MLRRSGASLYSRDHIKFIFCPFAWKREIDEVLSMVYRDGEYGRCVCSLVFGGRKKQQRQSFHYRE